MMSPHSTDQPAPGDEVLLTPREVAAVFGVGTPTIALWARTGRLKPGLLTPGGHRRYRRTDVLAALDQINRLKQEADEDWALAEDAVRLYQQGWSIRQVADRFECSYGAMRASC